MGHLAPAAPPILLAEILSFSPQLFLDDIIDSATEAIEKCMSAMEGFLDRWADDRTTKKGGEDWDRMQEVEQGLVAFQTLLEYHTDVAFDFLELWCKRNIFALPADLPVIAPHQAGLDLKNMEEAPQAETELLMEVEELRRKVDNQRRLQRLYTRAARVSALHRARSERRLDALAFLSPSSSAPSSPPTSSATPSTHTLTDVPPQLITLFSSLRDLPSADDALALSSQGSSKPASSGVRIGKREWEVGKEGYLSWAVGELVGRVRAERGHEVTINTPSGSAITTRDMPVADALADTRMIGSAEDVKSALLSEGARGSIRGSRAAQRTADDMEVDE